MDNKNKYEGTKTEKDLQAKFVCESMESEKSNIMDSLAKKKGFEQFADFLQEFADDGQEDVRFKNGELNRDSSAESFLTDTDIEENSEWTEMYEGFAITTN